MWPAFWLVGNDIGTRGWPACGEIDIVELIGHEPGKIYGSLHGPCYAGDGGLRRECILPKGRKFSGRFHVFAVEWGDGEIRWFVDGKLYGTQRVADFDGQAWVFDKPFFITLNLAVGGDWPGPPDETTVFPKTMQVDWVRVYEDRQASGPPAGAGTNGLSYGSAVAIPSLVIPGVIEAEHFDAGGEGVGYHDTDPENWGCVFRQEEGVDIEPCEDGEKGWQVGYTKAGEWLNFTATVTAEGRYRLGVRVASRVKGGIFHLEMDGRDLTGPLTVPDTGGWRKFITVSRNGILLPAGAHSFRLVMDAEGGAGVVGYINRMVFDRETGRGGGYSSGER